MWKRQTRSSSGEGRQRPSPKVLLQKLLAVPLGRCLPEIALCLLLCCVATGYIVLRVEQKEQYYRDTFEVYLQEHGHQAVTAQTAPPQSEPAQAAQEEVTASVEPSDAVHIYAAPSGKRYHYDAACAGKNGQEITWAEAQQRGLTPCKKCVT